MHAYIATCGALETYALTVQHEEPQRKPRALSDVVASAYEGFVGQFRAFLKKLTEPFNSGSQDFEVKEVLSGCNWVQSNLTELPGSLK